MWMRFSGIEYGDTSNEYMRRGSTGHFENSKNSENHMTLPLHNIIIIDLCMYIWKFYSHEQECQSLQMGSLMNRDDNPNLKFTQK